MTRTDEIAQRLKRVSEDIAEAAIKNGRAPEDISLVAVTKNMPVSDLAAAYKCGLRNFGENRVQEALTKTNLLPEDIHWHLIGSLQRNKARKAVDFASLIHSVDRMSLAQTLQAIGVELGKKIQILVEVNVSGEETKAGIDPDLLLTFLAELESLDFLEVKGLMTIAPQVAKAEKARPYFALLSHLAEEAKDLKLQHIKMDYLSMGMSDDFTAAIAEGANIVRIGRGIFGPRRY